MTPQRLATPLQSLPPILHITYPKPVLSYSKGSRGLFVPLVNGIFTVTNFTEPFGGQYPIVTPFGQVGTYPTRNSHLRTVIVTAAVYWGFISDLRQLNPPLNLPAPAGAGPIHHLRFSRARVFDKQSPASFHCAPPMGRPSPEVTGRFASSLAMIFEHLRILIPTTCVGLGTGCSLFWNLLFVFASTEVSSAYISVSTQTSGDPSL